MMSMKRSATLAMLFMARYRVISNCYSSFDDLIMRSRRATLMILRAVKLN